MLVRKYLDSKVPSFYPTKVELHHVGLYGVASFRTFGKHHFKSSLSALEALQPSPRPNEQSEQHAGRPRESGHA